MKSFSQHLPRMLALSALSAAVLAACGGGNDDNNASANTQALPQLSAASGATLTGCNDLASRISYPNLAITAANPVATGTLTIGGKPVPAHCQVTGKMFQRVSGVDGQIYAIGFEMRLPNAWNGRFFYQGNGGTDGSVVTATGPVGGGGPLDSALSQGFAVISSDAGHAGPTANFGIDPQARLDYGYQAVGKLTPMAKNLIQTAYGKGPDRSYIGGCSNGGRHTMMAAARYPDQYDGYLVGDPGYRLPLAAIANLAGGRTYAALASTPNDLSTGFTVAERTLVSNAVLDKCDVLDGAKDGLVQNPRACQTAFNLDRDVPTCTGTRDGSCLSGTQKTSIAKLFSGATTESGAKIYSSFPYDAGLATPGWATWKFTSPAQRDAGAVALVWKVPPVDPTSFDANNFMLSANLDSLVAQVSATNSVYTESALSFMIPPNVTNLGSLKNRGAKMMVYHGTSDPIFSSEDTQAWYEALRTANAGDASNFAKYYQVPGMNHCSGGPATDQFDMLTPLVNWVEKNQVPDSVQANARGAGNVGGINTDVPSTWSVNRGRPLCPYPKIAVYKGAGNVEDAASFTCQNPS